MQVTELSAEGLKRQFKIVVPAGDLSAKVDERLAELAKTAQMPGFRQGKVPVGLLKKQYGQALFGEALEQAVNSSTAKAPVGYFLAMRFFRLRSPLPINLSVRRSTEGL